MPYKPIYHGDYFIVEHPTRGTLKFFVSPDEYGFSTSGLRGDPEKTKQFDTARAARMVIEQLPSKLKAKCEVRTAARSFDIVPERNLPKDDEVISKSWNCWVEYEGGGTERFSKLQTDSSTEVLKWVQNQLLDIINLTICIEQTS